MNFFNKEYPLIIAHRGYASGKPFNQNSLSAFKYAQRIGTDGYECDIRLTNDNKVIIHHDSTIKTLHGIKWIHKMNYKAIADIYGDSDTVPLLNDVMKIPNETQYLFIEIKAKKQVKKICEILTKTMNFNENTFFMAYNSKIYSELTKYDLVTGKYITFPRFKHIKELHQNNSKIISPLYWFFWKSHVEKYRDNGIAVIPWTINKSKMLKTYIKWNVDAIYTNELELAKMIRKDTLGL